MKYLILFLSFIFLSNFVYTQWVQTNGPGGPGIQALAMVGGNIFAGTWEDGIFISKNNGSSWSAVNNGLPKMFLFITDLAVNDTELYAAAGAGYGIYCSTDYGANWHVINNGLSTANISSFAFLGENIFVGTDKGVFHSIDHGNNWIETNDIGLSDKSIRILAVSNTKLFAGTKHGVFLSTDKGTNWIEVNNGLDEKSVWVLFAQDNNLFAGTEDGIFLSTNNGNNWIETSSGLTNKFIYEIKGNDSKLYVITQDGVSFSTNNGKSWTPIVNNNELSSKNVLSIALNATNIFVGTYHSGVFVSSDNGQMWKSINTGLPGYYINDLFVEYDSSIKKLFAGTLNYGIFLSVDDGSTWKEINGGLPIYTSVLSIASIESNLFIGTSIGDIYLSTDNGNNWINKSSLKKPILCFKVFLQNSNEYIFFAGTDGSGIFLSTDKGMSWNPSNNGFLYNNTIVCDIEMTPNESGGNNVFLGTNEGIYLSTNNGTNWIPLDSGLTNTFILSLAINGTNLYAGTNGGGIFCSSNNGTSWTPINAGLSNFYVNSLIAVNGNIFAGTNNGIFINNGSNIWTNVSDGLVDNFITTLSIYADYLYLGTYNYGTWRRSLNEMFTDVDEEENILPSHYSLAQNYPNPFNQTTTIKYSLPKASFVTIKIFDVLGKEVEPLLNEEKPTGNYQVDFDGSNLASSVYFYRIQAGDFVKTKKLLLLK